MKVVFCTPSLTGPTEPYLKAIEDSIPLIKKAGFEEAYAQKVGCPYISHARSTMTRDAMDVGADIIVYLDYDLSWKPQDLLSLIQTEGEVVSGLYRFKKDEEEYMGVIKTHADGRPIVKDGNLIGEKIPAGFMKVTKAAVQRFMRAYPELLYGDPDRYSVDLFNHGAHKGVWYGEDYAFSRRWMECGGEIVVLPNLDLVHHSKDKAYQGNFHEFMMKQPGGINDPLRKAA